MNGPPRLTAVLVDAKNSAGITVSEHNYPTRGLKGCGFKSVKFEDVSNYIVQIIKLVLVSTDSICYRKNIYRVSRQLVLNFDFNFWFFWLSYQKNLIWNKTPNGLT